MCKGKQKEKTTLKTEGKKKKIVKVLLGIGVPIIAVVVGLSIAYSVYQFDSKKHAPEEFSGSREEEHIISSDSAAENFLGGDIKNDEYYESQPGTSEPDDELLEDPYKDHDSSLNEWVNQLEGAQK